MNRIQKTQGLTLVETLLVASIMSIMALTLYNALSNGLRVWDRVNTFLVEEDIAIFFEDITQDLHNVVTLTGAPFEGQPHDLSFPAVIYTKEDPKINPTEENYVHQIGRVRYFFDSLDDKLYRQEANYGLMQQGKFFDGRAVVRSLKEVKFFYYTQKEEKMVEMIETRSWPMMVRIMVRYVDAAGQEYVMEKSVVLPVYALGHV